MGASPPRHVRLRDSRARGGCRRQRALGRKRSLCLSLGGALRAGAECQVDARARAVRGARRSSRRRVGRAIPVLLAAGASLRARRMARRHRARLRARRRRPRVVQPLRPADRGASGKRRVHDPDGGRRAARFPVGQDFDGGLARAPPARRSGDALVHRLRVSRRLRRAGEGHVGVGRRPLLRVAPARRAGPADVAGRERLDRQASHRDARRPHSAGRTRGANRTSRERAGASPRRRRRISPDR